MSASEPLDAERVYATLRDRVTEALARSGRTVTPETLPERGLF